MPVQDAELIEWNEEASDFLCLSGADQELYIAAVNAGGDPDAVLAVLTENSSLEALSQVPGIDLGELLLALPSDTIELVGEVACGVLGF